MPEDIATIKPDVTNTKLDDELYRIKIKVDSSLKQENAEIIKSLSVGAETLDAYAEKFKKQIEKISDSNKAALAEYVVYRKVIIELFKQGIRGMILENLQRKPTSIICYIQCVVLRMKLNTNHIIYG